MAKVNFTICTETQYSELNPPTSGTFYYVVAEGQVSTPDSPENTVHKLYIGTKLIGSGLTLDEVIYALEHNEYVFPGVTAGDITPKSDAPIEVSSFYDIQTTGGDNDLKSGPAEFRGIRGNLYNQSTGATANNGDTTAQDNLRPFYATSYNSVGMNLFRNDSGYVISGTMQISDTIASHSTRKIYVFPVTNGTWGTYGTTDGNNGYVITGAGISAVKAVKYFATTFSTYSRPDVRTTVSSFSGTDTTGGTHVREGVTYYLPPKGWMLVEFESDLTFTENDGEYTVTTAGGDEVGCHIAWSNYNDEVPGTSWVHTVDISQAIEAIHSWGLAGIVGGTKSVYDEVDVKTRTGYKRLDRVALNTISWTLAETGETTKTYTGTVTTMAEDGLWACDNDSASVSVTGNVISVTIASDAQTSALTGYLYFELAESVEVSLTSQLGVSDYITKANDFGLTYFQGTNGKLTVPVKVWVEESFQQSGKDQIFNNITYVKTLAEVVATALCELDDRLKPIEDGLENGFQYLQVGDLVVENLTVNGTSNIMVTWIDF